MAVLSITGQPIARADIYAKPAKQSNNLRKRKNRRNLAAKPKYTMSKQQAQRIIDERIARRLKKMFC